MGTTDQNVKIQDINFKLDNWMGDLGKNIEDLPISRLIIPGTHDSGTSSIIIPTIKISGKKRSIISRIKLAIEAIEYLKAVSSKAQNLSISDQLSNGARYIDLRIQRYKGAEYRLYHGFKKCGWLDPELESISEFIKYHKQEIVIIGITPYEKHEQSDFNKILNTFKTKFDNKIASLKDFSGESCIKHFLEKEKQIILVWNNNHYPNVDTDLFWKIKGKDNDNKHFESVYGGLEGNPNEGDPKNFIIELEKRIKNKDSTAYRPFVIQGVVPAPLINLNPKTWKNILKYLKDDSTINIHKMAKTVHEQFITFINGMRVNGPKSLLNIITIDFFDECPDFINQLIRYNIKKQGEKLE